jgi:hypothetical protein
MKPTIPEVVPLFAAYYQKPGNGVWGSLHCVLDDGNVRNCDVEDARFHAAERHDEDGKTLANILARMSRTQRLKLPDAVDDYIKNQEASNDL